MKLKYKAQIALTVILALIGNILTDIFDFWLYRSLAYILSGLLHIAHPVAPKGMEGNRKAEFYVQVAGVILIFLGVFTRVNHF